MPRIRAQLRPSDTNAATLYHVDGDNSPDGADIGPLGAGYVVVSNSTDNEVACRICHDPRGNTMDESTQLAWDLPVRPHDSRTFPVGAMTSPVEHLLVRTATASALTFTYHAEDASP